MKHIPKIDALINVNSAFSLDHQFAWLLGEEVLKAGKMLSPSPGLG